VNIRTDIAVENFDDSEPLPEGIHRYRRGGIFSTTEIVIDSDDYVKETGKGKGKYVSLESRGLSGFSDNYREMAEEIAEEISKFVPGGEVLVIGLGNTDITPDSIGPITVSKVLATRHLRFEGNGDDFLRSLRSVSCISAGVMGQTGIESAEVVKAVCSEIKPSAVIAVDSLACSDIKRLGTTIQITDTGISPGSGVANARKELSEKTLGIPVIAIGIPTVTDMRTIVYNLTGTELERSGSDMMVTPRDIDRLTERSSHILSLAVNLALQPSLTFEEVSGLF